MACTGLCSVICCLTAVPSDTKDNDFSLVGGGDHCDFMPQRSLAASMCRVLLQFEVWYKVGLSNCVFVQLY